MPQEKCLKTEIIKRTKHLRRVTCNDKRICSKTATNMYKQPADHYLTLLTANVPTKQKNT